MMSYQEFVKRVLTVTIIVILAMGFWQLRSLFINIFLASVIALLLSIPVTKLEERGISRGVSVGITLFFTLIGMILFFAWILPTLFIQTSDLVQEFPDAFDAAADEYNLWHERQQDIIRDVLPEADLENIREDLGFGDDDAEPIVTLDDVTEFAVPLVGSAGNILASLIANLAFVLIVTLFLLLDPQDYLRGILYLIPLEHQERALEVIVELRGTLTAWMSALSLSMTVTAVLVWIFLGLVLGVPNAIAIGVIAAAATIIPNIGAIIPLVPIAIFTLANEPNKLIPALVAYFIIQQVESNLITPSIVKRELSIPAALVFAFQLISAFLFGALGVLLAVPLLATVITLVRELYVYDTLKLRDVEIEIKPGTHLSEITMIRRIGGNDPVTTQAMRILQLPEDSRQDNAASDVFKDYPKGN